MENSKRLVHLDLKGAPPKVAYFEKIFPLLKKWGATGLLIEYEDMFPYWGPLSEIASEYAYSKECITSILQLAQENHLTVIPLVQSIGHFEFVLKREKFKSLREVPNYPMALCPSNSDSLLAVCMMIDQVVELHPGIRFFHIGADEVYHLGVCEKCKRRMAEEGISAQQLFLVHVKAILCHIKETHPNINSIMWDDMLRHIELPVLLNSGLGDLVEPMVWHYLTTFMLPSDIWDKYSTVFPSIWIASAFKGATGANVYATNIAYHVNNHTMWLDVMAKMGSKFKKVQGCALTGWQRYDHYAVLCELLPQALPSLGICLLTLQQGSFTAEVHATISQDLKFHSPLPLNPFERGAVPPCQFPGCGIYLEMLAFLQLDASYGEFVHDERVLTWMNEYMMEKKFSNPVHIEPILAQSSVILDGISKIYSQLELALKEVYHPNTVEEWLKVFVEPKMKKMSDVVEKAKIQLSNP
ncbi:hexosaminidase D-like [Ostrea edulis]|uniref:hexosaminidase D-like n=1 Tax=Ostrea edulis TaxID=37623 RepID=UPI0024AF8ED5|nr:hexosaminidase D-like [Ostrea edulis]